MSATSERTETQNRLRSTLLNLDAKTRLSLPDALLTLYRLRENAINAEITAVGCGCHTSCIPAARSAHADYLAALEAYYGPNFPEASFIKDLETVGICATAILVDGSARVQAQPLKAAAVPEHGDDLAHA